jgi:hypothetical protein
MPPFNDFGVHASMTKVSSPLVANMHSPPFLTPVALFVFRRPDTTRRVFDAIAAARPARLLLIADGPRSNRPEEAEACRAVREIVSRVDWPCEVSTNFSEDNLGCGERMISGLNWVFSLVEEAILLEDDCLPDPTFFPFCQDLLERYRGDSRVAYITGCNLAEKDTNTEASYFFSRIGMIWGWATWRSQWQRYDRHLTAWPAMRDEKTLSEVFDDSKTLAYWTRIFDDMHEKRGPNTWDYQWFFTCLVNNSSAAISKLNLITNIGFGPDATHTTELEAISMLPAKQMTFPMKHPSSFIPLRSMDRRLRKRLTSTFSVRVKRKFRDLSRQLFRSRTRL